MTLATESIQQKFSSYFNGNKNAMTPNVIEYGQKGRYIYDLSSGGIFRGKKMHGVTVLELDGDKILKPAGLSEGMISIQEARELINSLGVL